MRAGAGAGLPRSGRGAAGPGPPARAWQDASPRWALGLWAAVGLTLAGGARWCLRWYGQGPLEALQKAALRRLPVG
ncbi:hypothetical protein ACGF5C_04265 [Micromonospora sp. NPDC047620]|uniref:hypothetical protein n=1 Tax=Micromonospora sp. NPDC047620 TaxID=3364251 RepID=UPI00371EB04C